MAGLKDYQISVYVANLGKYVEGVLQGAWITLPMPAERLQDTLKTEVGLGGRYEEYAIHDYEGGEGLLATVANPGEYESLTDLNLMCRAFEAREDDDPDVYEKVQTVRDDLDAVPRTPLQYANLALNSDEIPYHSYDAPSSAESKEAKYAWTAVNHGWASDAVWSMFDAGLGYLIDMEMYGRDLKLDGDVSLGDNGYLEDADWPSDIDGRYSREEIAEEVEWLDDFDAKTGSPAAFDLASLVQPGERIADYTISGIGTNWGAPSYQCIVEEGSTDIHAALEDTMHRIIDARAATGDAADVLADLQAWWKTSQPDMRQHVDEMMAGIDAAMEPLDKRLYAAAEKEFKERSLDPDGECYQLDVGTFISQESFDGICGDQRDRYMAWKNQAEPARLVSAWDDPARLDRLVGDLIDADDGGGCFYTDAQPIDYTQGMDYSPQQLAADSGLGDTVPLACESNASYSLAHHPDIKFTATGSPDGRKALEVSVPGSARHALITAKPGTFDVSLHDERGIVSGESFPYEANDSWTYRLSGQALRGALDLAVGWADPQETSPETAGLDLALDDGMETTHGR